MQKTICGVIGGLAAGERLRPHSAVRLRSRPPLPTTSVPDVPGVHDP